MHTPWRRKDLPDIGRALTQRPGHEAVRTLVAEILRHAFGAAYLDLDHEGRTPLFRSAVGRTGALTTTAMHRVDAWRMIQRRASELGTKVKMGCHSFVPQA